MNSTLATSENSSSEAPQSSTWQEAPRKLQEKAQGLDRRARDLVQQRPLAAVGIAVVLGYGLGWLWSRR